MRKPIKIKESEDRLITPSGILLAGALLTKTKIGSLLNRLGNGKEVTHQNNSCVIPYIGLLCQGKSDYEDVREMNEDPDFYCHALQIGTIPSVETLRQRMDSLGLDIASSDMIMKESARMLKNVGIKPTPTFTGHIPIDIDVSVHDNSQTKKEGVEWTYKGVDGYAPIYGYVGEEGYLCNVELREGSCHSQCEGTVDYLADTIALARMMTNKKLLARMDSGNDSLDNIKLFAREETDYVIKRNLRKETAEEWLAIAKDHGVKTSPREGKDIYTGSIYRDKGLNDPIRIVFCVTVRTIRADGQILLVPEIDARTWWTSLRNPEDEVIRLYREHATCEQFHSEIKTDIGLERFPSGKFDTNAAILKLAALAYNILRIIGQSALRSGNKLTRHDVKRLRAKTVIQRFMFIAGRVITHARQIFITFGRSNIWHNIFAKLYMGLC